MPSGERRARFKSRLRMSRMLNYMAVGDVNEEAVREEEEQQQRSMEAVGPVVNQEMAASRLRSLRARCLNVFKQYMDNNFYKNDLHGYCYVCDRIWWSNMLTKLRDGDVAWQYLQENGYDPTIIGLKVCRTCHRDLRMRRTPKMATVNGLVYPKVPNLPPLGPIAERLISPRLPFMCIRNVRYFMGSRKLYGQIINVPVEVDTMVRALPRSIDDDMAINVRIKKHLLSNSSYLSGCVSKTIVKEWLRYLINTPLYQRHNVQLKPEYCDAVLGVPDPINATSPAKAFHQIVRQFAPVAAGVNGREEPMDRDESSGERVLAQVQQSLFWGENFTLEMAPGQHNRPLALAFDEDAEELSFPNIYYGQQRTFKVPVTPFQVASSEIRRFDRRGVKSDHILYMAAKIMRLRMIASFNVMFRNRQFLNSGESITRRQLENPQYLRESLERNESFMSCLPNSIQYWQRRKKDLFAMMRQLGKPTVFLTLSASEIHWLPLLKCIYRYQHDIPQDQPVDDIEFVEMTNIQRALLVISDPVLCCLYFERLVVCILNALKLKKGPFGKYRVIEYFRRIEFQHRGSPHCHMLLWLDNAPGEAEIKFVNGEIMPQTIALIDELCSVDGCVVASNRPLQTHRHTHTCYKRNNKTCRFDAPFWPMKSTRVLLPVREDEKNEALVQRCKSLHELLASIDCNDETTVYNTIDEFWRAAGVDSENEYLDIIRHGIRRPKVMYKRAMKDIMVSPFNPTISNVLDSNMDIQFILDEYSCAAYVAEYVNKSERGFSSLHRELVKLRDEYPDMDYDTCLKELGKRTLNNIEMCTQEAAWFLLRLPMSESTRNVVLIPTQHPVDRFKCKKTTTQMNREGLSGDSTDVWRMNIVHRYECRPTELENETLADFVAWYDRIGKKSKTVEKEGDDVDGGGKEDGVDDGNNYDESGVVNNDDDDHGCGKYRRRKWAKVIRWKHYSTSDMLNYKRCLVTLFWKFQSEELDLLNNDKYLQIFEENEALLIERLSRYQSGMRIDDVLAVIRDDREASNSLNVPVTEEDDGDVVDRVNLHNDENGDVVMVDDANRDIDLIQRDTVVRTVKSTMTHEEYCRRMRRLNIEQRALSIEFITDFLYGDGGLIQAFLTGPAGTGKTELLILLMETINRFALRRNMTRCAYLACATTGKAAVNIDGTTVHSALHIPITTKESRVGLAFDRLQTMRCDLAEVCVIIIDEVSMMSQSMLNRVSERLRSCGKDPRDKFGGFHVILCGDLRQLPPVNASPVYVRPKNILQDNMIWQNLSYYPLHRVMRQSNERFANILTKIGDGRRLDDEDRALLESRFFTKEDIESRADLQGAVRIFHCNKDVDRYNFERMNSSNIGMIEVHSDDTIIGIATAQQREAAYEKLYTMRATETGYLARRLYIAVDTPYSVTQNIDKKDRLVNGTTGLLKFIENKRRSDGCDKVVRLWFKFDDDACGVKLRLKYSQYMREFGIDPSYTPIIRRELPVNLGMKMIKCKRKQFPVLPCYAQTIHKVQGASFDQVVYDYDRKHNVALVYVALSRARSLEGLYLTNAAKNNEFYHCRKDDISRKAFRDEIARLESKRLTTVVEKCQEFITDASLEGQVSIASFNVQSANAHYEDVNVDPILQNVSVLAMSETWMYGEGGIGCGDLRNGCNADGSLCAFANETDSDVPTRRVWGHTDKNAVKINGFRCIARSRREFDKTGGGGVAIYESLKSNFKVCHRIELNTVKAPYGDVCCAYMQHTDVKTGSDKAFCLIALYGIPGINADKLIMLIEECMWRFSRQAMSFDTSQRRNLYWCPVVMCGDFNFNFVGNTQGDIMLDYMKNMHMLENASKSLVGCTSRNGTTIDAVFVKKAPLELMYYTLYFSTHRAIVMSTKESETVDENGDGGESSQKLRRPMRRRLCLDSLSGFDKCTDENDYCRSTKFSRQDRV